MPIPFRSMVLHRLVALLRLLATPFLAPAPTLAVAAVGRVPSRLRVPSPSPSVRPARLPLRSLAASPPTAPSTSHGAARAAMAEQAQRALALHLNTGGFIAASHLVAFGLRGSARAIQVDLRSAQGSAVEGVDRGAGWHAVTAALVGSWGQGEDGAVLMGLTVWSASGCADCVRACLRREDDHGRCPRCAGLPR